MGHVRPAKKQKQVLDLSRTATHHSVGKNVPDMNYNLFQTSCLLLFFIHNVILVELIQHS